MIPHLSPPASWPWAWVSRDAWLIIVARALRTFGQASLTILLAIYLDLLGLDLFQIGLFISAGLAGSAVFASLIVFIGDTLGRRRLLTGFTLLAGLASIALALTDQFLLLALVAFVGSFNAAGGGPMGPAQPLEQAALPGTASPERRTELFAIYNIASTGARAIGAAAAGLPILFQGAFDMSETSSYKVMFASYALIAALAAALYAMLSPMVEARTEGRRWTNPLRTPSRRIIFSMAGLFSLDSFGTSLVVQSLVALWFYGHFGVDLGSIAFIFVGSHVMAAVSLWLAAKLASRLGLVNTIVFTHVPAVLLVLILPFMPTATLATACWLARAFFSQMDIPVKQSYTMSVVNADERSAMAGINNVSQSIVRAASPAVATFLWGSVAVAAPFVGSALFKSIYLVGFYLLCRNVLPPEEQRKRDEAQRAAS